MGGFFNGVQISDDLMTGVTPQARNTFLWRHVIVAVVVAAGIAGCSTSEPGSSAAPDAAGKADPTAVAPVSFPFVNGTVSTPGTRVYLAGGLTSDSRPGGGDLQGNPEVVRLGADAVPDLRWTLDLGADQMLRSASVVELLAGRVLVANACSGIGWTDDAGLACGPTTPAVWRLDADGSTERLELAGALLDGGGGPEASWVSVAGTLDGMPLLAARSTTVESVGADLVRLYTLDIATGSTTEVASPAPMQRPGQVCAASDGTLRVVEARVSDVATIDGFRVHQRRPDATWQAGEWMTIEPPVSLNAAMDCVGSAIAVYEPWNARMALIDPSTGSVAEVSPDPDWAAAGQVSVRSTHGRLLVATVGEDLTTVSYRWVDPDGTITAIDHGAAELHRPNVPTPVVVEGELWDITGLVAEQPGIETMALG